ncbi:MAG: two pore domain potassium channel family protein [Anaerolineales bacterium]|nr:two pore domain potassium channel family protein [Anaerolineales bacterium]
MFYQIRRTLAHHHPSAFLLSAQLLFLMLYALFDEFHNQQALLSAFNILVLVLVVWVVNRSSKIQWIGWVIATPAFIFSLLSALTINSHLLLWTSLFNVVLYFYATGALIVYMMGDYRVTTDELFAAAATFTLLAWGFAYAYLTCQTWIPGSFISSINPEPSLTFLELLSLSFTNLTATGLSDILPVTDPARIIVMIEQFVGIGYVAMVVSRLIGMTIAQRERKRG